jgi:hypothetical protein
MTCTEFVARFTDYEDGIASAADVEAMEEHLGRCVSCRRYKAVVERGAALLRSLPVPELREDFAPRLQNRLYRIQESLPPEPNASRTPAVAVFGVAVLLTVVAWSPFLLGSPPVIELPPIVVDRAPEPPPARSANLQERPLELRSAPELDLGLWDDTRLYEYSALSRRYDGSARTRQVGFVPNR